MNINKIVTYLTKKYPSSIVFILRVSSGSTTISMVVANSQFENLAILAR